MTYFELNEKIWDIFYNSLSDGGKELLKEKPALKMSIYGCLTSLCGEVRNGKKFYSIYEQEVDGEIFQIKEIKN